MSAIFAEALLRRSAARQEGCVADIWLAGRPTVCVDVSLFRVSHCQR